MKHLHRDRTAGLTSENAVAQIGNRYDLVLVAARRMRELNRGDAPRVPSHHDVATTALLEIEAQKVGRDYLLMDPEVKNPRRDRRARHHV